MRSAIILVCVAVATASFLPASHHSDAAKWSDESSAKHDFNKGTHDDKTSGFKDNKAGNVAGGQNFHHKEQYTATKHNIVKDKHVVNHNSDDNKAIVNHNAYAQGYGNSYKVGGSQKNADSGKDGKVEHHVHQAGHHAGYLGNYGHQGYPTYGQYSGYGGHGINKASSAKHNQHDNSWATHGASASDKNGAQQGHVNSYGNNGDAYDRFVKHNEVHTSEDEDYAHKDVLQEANRNSNYQKADATHADKGQSYANYDHATGHDSQWKASSGHKDSDKHAHGKGASGSHVDSSTKAAGKSHQDHNAKNGGHHSSHDTAADKHGSSYNTHGDKHNKYNVKTKKVHKVESVVNHADGYSKDNFGDFKFDQAKYGFGSDWYKTSKDNKKDNSYNNYNNQYAAQYYLPAQPAYPSYFGYQG